MQQVALSSIISYCYSSTSLLVLHCVQKKNQLHFLVFNLLVIFSHKFILQIIKHF